MRAIEASGVPKTLNSYVGILTRSRRGLPSGVPMPRLERGPIECRIEPGWLAAYSESIGLPVGKTLPPLALQLAANPLHLALLADPVFPYRAFGLLHVSQRVEQPGPIPSDARLMLTAFTEPAEPSPRGARFKIVTEARIGSALVQRAETMALSPGKSNGPAPQKSEPEPDPGKPRYEGELDVPESIGRRYASIAGDFNPIHQHAILARPFGYKRAIVHGTWTAGCAMVMAGLPTSEAFELYLRFRKPVSLPSKLRVFAFRDGTTDRIRVTSRDGKTLHTELEIKPR
jgi:acyl dehydratase